MSLYPPYFLTKFPDLLNQYIIRPYQDQDYDQVRKIFEEGMLSYSDDGGAAFNSITPFPTFDEHHAAHIDVKKKQYCTGFKSYTDWCLNDPNLTDIPHYWAFCRRSVFLVAEMKATKTICGTVAIQPIEYNISDDKYVMNFCSNRNQLNKYLTSNSTIFNISQFRSFCTLSLGTIPADFYNLDDPLYAPDIFTTQWTVMLPQPSPQLQSQYIQDKWMHTNIKHPQSQQQNPSPLIPNDPTRCTCQCAQLRECPSQKVSLQWSRCSPKHQAKLFETISEEVIIRNNTSPHLDHTTLLSPYFCPCIINADKILLDLAHNQSSDSSDVTPSPPVCPFCIKDAQYLIQPYIAMDIPQSTPTNPKIQYEVNPVLFHYPNQLSNLLNLSPSTKHYPVTLQNQLPFYTTSPPGFYRRSQPAWDKLNPEALVTNHLSLSSSSIASVDINAYTHYLKTAHSTNFLAQQLQYYDSGNTNYTFPLPLPATSLDLPELESYIPKPFFNCCELRRMSISKEGGHRGIGLGGILLFVALAFAKIIFHYDQLHLSTSFFTMDQAVKFYRRMFFREAVAEFEAFENEWPIAHYTFNFSRNGTEFDIKRWTPSYSWNDYFHTWLLQKQIQETNSLTNEQEKNEQEKQLSM